MWMRNAVLEDEDRLQRGEGRQVVRRSIRRLRPYRGHVALALVVLSLSTGCLLAGPQLVRYGIDKGLNPRHPSVRRLDLAVAGYVVVAVGALVLQRSQILLVTRVGENFLRDLRVGVFDHLQRMSMAFFDREPAGRLVARLTSDIDALADRVVLLDEGRIVAEGRHEDLLRTCERYREVLARHEAEEAAA